MHNAADFPNDITALKALLIPSHEALASSQSTVAKLEQVLSSRELQIEALQLQIMVLRRQFGRKSEKLDYQIEQLELKLEELQTDEGQAIPADATERLKKRASRPVRKPSPITCRATSSTMLRPKRHVRPAAAHWPSWEKTFPKCSNTFRPASW